MEIVLKKRSFSKTFVFKKLVVSLTIVFENDWKTNRRKTINNPTGESLIHLDYSDLTDFLFWYARRI